MDASQGAQAIIELFAALSNAQVSGEAVQNGQRLLTLLTTLLIAWTGIQMMLEFEPVNSAIARIAHTAIVWGFASFMIGTAAGGGIFQEIQTGMKSIAASVAPAGTNGDQFVVMGKMVDSATKIWLGPKKNASQAGGSQSSGSSSSQGGQSGGIGEKVSGLLSLGDSMLENVLFGILSVITRFFVGVFVLISGLLYFGTLIVAQVMFKIAAIMMPFMVPWIVFEQTSFLFNGWLKFTIGAGLQIVVANIIYGLTLGIVDKVVNMVASIQSSPQSEYLVYAAALLITGIMAFVMMQASTIANGLLSGHASGKWTPTGKLTPNGGASAASSTASNSGKSAASVANRAAGAVMGGVSGARAGTGGVAGARAGWTAGAASQVKQSFSKATGTKAQTAGGVAAKSTAQPAVSSAVQNVRQKMADIRAKNRG